MVSTSLPIFDSISTRKLHVGLAVALVFLFGVAVLREGVGPVELLGASIIGAVLLEMLWTRAQPQAWDGQVAVWAGLFVLSLPQGSPWPIALAGGFVLVLVKRLFGGSTGTWINPILAAWAFCNLSWPQAFGAVVQRSSPLAVFHQALSGGGANPMAGVSPSVLDQSWTAGLNQHLFSWINVNLPSGYVDLITGNLSNSVAAGSTLVLLALSVWLFVARFLPWEIPAAAAVGLGLPSWIFGGLFFHHGWFTGDVLVQVFGGSFLVGIILWATVTASRPFCRQSWLVWGSLVGVLVFALRFSGIQIDGTAPAILLAGLTVPWIDQFFSQKPRT